MMDNAYSITQLTRIIKTQLEENPELNNIWIRGEASNITYHSSGHIYLTLKDENALISAVFFKYVNRSLSFRLEEGMSIYAMGNITIFEKRGSYQFRISQIRLEGIGELQKRIEELKQRLAREGIFDQSRKRKPPLIPRRIGIVTSPTGAAFRDIIKVAMQRFPNIEIMLAPALVQGTGAAESIARGIEELNDPRWGIDVIIAGRGGGSFEDLMPFNEEITVRAIAGSRVPIISAVGHQIDHPITDDAADRMAPTPSAAAEMAVPVKYEVQDYIDHLLARSRVSVISMLREGRGLLEAVSRRRIFTIPRQIAESREMILTELESRLLSSMKDTINVKKEVFLRMPDLSRLIYVFFQKATHRYQIALQSLEKLSPLSILGRGYAITRDNADKLIKSISSVIPGEKIKILFIDGELKCTVNSISDGEPLGKKK